MKLIKRESKPRSMVNLTVRLIFVVFTLLIALLLGFSYQFSSTAVTQEIERNITQTASLLQNLIDYRLGTMQSNQNSQTNSVTLSNFVESEDISKIDDYFISIDQANLKNSPDFRFISKSQSLFWDDGNASFFGIDQRHLDKLVRDVAYSDSWHFIALSTNSGERHLLIRRMPVVESNRGEVLGKLFIVMVLNNNFALVENLKNTSNTTDVVLMVNGKPVASTVKLNRDLLIRIQESKRPSPVYNSTLMANSIDVKVDGVISPISVYSLQDNQNFLSLEDNFKISLIFSFFSIVISAFLARFLIHKRITSELTSLMAYAKIARDERKVSKFEGSIVSEFDHIGHTLEHTFSELLEKEKLFQDLFNFALSPIVVWNGDGKIIRMNPAAEKAFRLDDVHNEGDYQAFQMRIVAHIKMVATGAVLTGIKIPISKTVYLWNLSPISLDDEIHTIIGQGLDITSLVEAERQSNLARVEAEKTATARAEFMARISHEIRTPLNGILGISQLLKKSTHRQDQAEKIDVLCQSGEHLLAVLNDILDFSRIEQGKLNIEKSSFVLASLVNTIKNIYSPLCDDKNIKLNVSNQVPRETMILSDQVRLTQILFNLLSNALKFTHSGQIDVIFSMLLNQQGKTQLNIEVSDTGIGISDQNLQTIFDPFTQSERTSIREYGGSGLGLSIVKLLVDMLEGEVNITSKEHIGTTLLLRIPIDEQNEWQSLDTTYRNNRPIELFDRKLSMLLVEDNKTNAFIAKAFCEKYGFTVDWAEDGVTALDQLKKKTFDLIMMDNQMPNMDGIETTQLIRDDMGLMTPIIACTADGFEETKQAFLAAGADFVLVKPIKERPLREALLLFKANFIDR
ncbi:LuxQ periplasmic sensor domain-containing protein [Vibrio sp. F74]|uniref:LuxQ periplasmic sensor domain-containing protein n=1 Tax=Vibrio sp. F74 TaxID=700020 RepID=UPI0035F555E2